MNWNNTNWYKGWVIVLSTLLLLTITFNYASMKTIDKLNQTLDEQSMLIYYRDAQIFTLEEEISNLQNQNKTYKNTISELNSKLEILITFKDAGLSGQNVDDIRQLLELADNIPYGSPFKHGHKYTSMYGNRDESTFGGSPNGHHKGVDIIPLRWSDKTILATANGEIVDFGYSEVMGKYIVFETSEGYRLKYAHLETIFWQDLEERKVKNIPIKKGEKLGIMGNTGTWSTGAHLHLEIHVYDSETKTYKELNPWRIIEFIGGLEDKEVSNG